MQPVIRYPDPEGWLRSLEFDQQERAASDDFGGQQPASVRPRARLNVQGGGSDPSCRHRHTERRLERHRALEQFKWRARLRGTRFRSLGCVTFRPGLVVSREATALAAAEHSSFVADGVGVGEHAATFANPAAALAAQDPAGLSVEVKWEEWREEPGFEWPAGEQPAPGAHEDAPMPGEEVNRGT